MRNEKQYERVLMPHARQEIEQFISINIAGWVSERTRSDTYLEIHTQMKEGDR
jgi:hypothetical protein